MALMKEMTTGLSKTGRQQILSLHSAISRIPQLVGSRLYHNVKYKNIDNHFVSGCILRTRLLDFCQEKKVDENDKKIESTPNNKNAVIHKKVIIGQNRAA